jgi:hypothetical protein
MRTDSSRYVYQFGGLTRSCILTSWIGALSIAWYLGSVPADHDTIGIREWLFPSVAFGFAAGGVLFAAKPVEAAMKGLVGLCLLGVVVQGIFILGQGPSLGLIPSCFTSASLCGAVTYLYVSRDLLLAIAGAFSAAFGVALLCGIVWLTVLLPPSVCGGFNVVTLVVLIFFGPVMGICMALPVKICPQRIQR